MIHTFIDINKSGVCYLSDISQYASILMLVTSS